MQTLNQIQNDFSHYLESHQFENQPRELYKPINYILSIGGKRLRPAVVMLSCYLFKGSYENALPAAYAVEVFHNFTLLHDDIMDEAPLRRGMPTVHEKFGANVGILSGDVMMVHAFDTLLQLEDQEQTNRVLRVFTKQAIEVCQGQQMDMNFETRDDVGIEEYLKMIELKTSVLLGAAMQIGALLGGANDKDASAIYEFGRNLGIAFQLQDDLLDTYGDPEKFGKKVGGDIAQNKKTILYLKAIKAADGKKAEQVKALYMNSEMEESIKISQVKKLFDELNVRAQTQRLQDFYKEKAISYLSTIDVPEERRKVMVDFAVAVMNREV